MKHSIKKRGQKFIRKFSRASIKASEEGKEHIKENLLERASHIKNIKLLIFEWGLLIIALIMLSITQAFWFGDSYANKAFTSGGTYTEATIGEVKSMNPLFAMTDTEKVLSKLMFATLSTVDYSGHNNIGLAKSITASQDGLVWTVKLRDNLKWSDGEPITNQDVIFTAKLIKNPLVNTIYNSNLANVKIAENEKGELVFTLPTAYADFISALNFPILPEHALKDVNPKTLVEDNFSTNPITSGPFTYNASQTTSTSTDAIIYLSANPDYYQSKPLLNNFSIHAFETKQEVINAVNAGIVTATAELSGNDVDQIKSSQFSQKISSLNAGAFVFLNTKSQYLKDPKLRTAIRQGINLNTVREKAPETAALDYPLISSQIKVNKLPKLPAYNPEAARTTVTKITSNKPFKLELATINSGYLPDIANAIAEELKAVGVDVNVSTYEENQDFANNVLSKRSYDILVYEVELGSDPDLLPYYHSSQATSRGLNLSNYRNPIVDDLLLGARDTLDQKVRVKKYETFLEYWVNDTPAIALYQPNLHYFYNKNTRTFSDNVKLVTSIDRFADVTDWAVSKTTKNKTP